MTPIIWSPKLSRAPNRPMLRPGRFDAFANSKGWSRWGKNELLDLTDDKYGLLGVTQLPVRRPQVTAVIDLDGDLLCWSYATPPEPAGRAEVHLFPSSNADSQIERGVPNYEFAEMAADVDSTGALDPFPQATDGRRCATLRPAIRGVGVLPARGTGNSQSPVDCQAHDWTDPITEPLESGGSRERTGTKFLN